MITALCILGSVVALVLILCILLLVLPVRLRFTLQGKSPSLALYLFGICIYRYPQKKLPKKFKRHRSKKQTKATKSPISLPDTSDPQALIEVAKGVLETLTSLFPKTTITLHKLWITPPAMDAAEAALAHTAVMGAVSAFLELLDSRSRLLIENSNSIFVNANFTGQTTEFSLSLSLSLPGHHVLRGLGQLGERFPQN